MSTIAENRDSIIVLSILAFTVLSIGVYIYKGIIKGAEIATKGDLLEAYYEGYKDGNSGNFISQYEAWTNSSTYERLMNSMTNKTIIVQIGNSDNKLTQEEWSKFVTETRETITKICFETHFDGGSRYDSQWQNVCFVGTSNIDDLTIHEHLNILRTKYRQDSIALTIGDTILVK